MVYNGIDPGERPRPGQIAPRRAKRSALPHDAFVVGTVGRLDPVKNLPALLRGARGRSTHTLRTRSVVIVGDGPERRRSKRRRAALGICEAVTFAGYRERCAFLMAAFDVYVNCSTYEGVSLTILEAMATALPVVATRVGGNPEVVVDQRDRAAGSAGRMLARDRSCRRRRAGHGAPTAVTRHFSIAHGRAHATPGASTRRHLRALDAADGR